jgi:hypothetical protein
MVHARLSTVARLILGGLGLSALTLLLTAKGLTPDPRGFGTHEQLGLTPCSFYRWTGRECPTCGATTAWALLLRSDGAAALQTNMAGTLLCVVAIVSVPWFVVSAILGRWWIVKPTANAMVLFGSGLAVIAVLDWAQRVWF